MLQKDFVIAISKSDMLDDELKAAIKKLPKRYLMCLSLPLQARASRNSKTCSGKP